MQLQYSSYSTVLTVVTKDGPPSYQESRVSASPGLILELLTRQCYATWRTSAELVSPLLRTPSTIEWQPMPALPNPHNPKGCTSTSSS